MNLAQCNICRLRNPDTTGGWCYRHYFQPSGHDVCSDFQGKGPDPKRRKKRQQLEEAARLGGMSTCNTFAD